MRAVTLSALVLLAGCLTSSAAYDISDLEVYPGRALLHDNRKNDYGCQCKNANWYCHGYCNIGTTSGDVEGCTRDCLICCGWGQAPPAAPKQEEPAPTPKPTPAATPAAAAEPQGETAAPNPSPGGAAGGPPAGLTKSATPTPAIRVVNQGRRLHQKSSGPPSSPSGGDWKGNGKRDGGKGDEGKDPNQCWNSFWSKYPWKK